MTQKEILITDYVHPVLLVGLQSRGYSTTYAPEMKQKEMAFLLEHYKGVVINTRCAIDRATLANTSSLKWIARLGSGLDIIDLKMAEEMHVQVLSAPEGNAEAVAEHAMAMILALSNKIIPADQSVKSGQWLREQHRGREIAGKTIGIIGHGNNGSAFGRLWKGWDVTVLAYDKYLKDYGTPNVMETDLDTLLRRADIISLHIPLTEETHGMINSGFLSKCRPGCVLINTSRGKITDLQAVADGLKSGHLGGVCLDVLPHEPPESGPSDFAATFRELCSFENVILSPHVAGWSEESKRKIAEVLLAKIDLLG